MSFISASGRFHIPFAGGAYAVAGASLTRVEYVVFDMKDWSNPILFNGDLGFGWSNPISSSLSFFVEPIHSRTVIGQDLTSATESGFDGTFQVTFDDLKVNRSTLSLGLGFSL